VAEITWVAHRGAFHALKATERTLAFSRQTVARLVDRVQFRLQVLEVRFDPDVKQWVSEMRSAVDRGEIQKALETQPPVEAIVDQWHRAPAAT
jgi:glyoxylate carboligase